ncbi:MAG: hypothetical protein ABI240_10615 [Sphingomonas sp.]
MNLGDLRIRTARMRLAVKGKDTYPRTMEEARETGKSLADALIKSLALSEQEASILTEVVDTALIYALFCPTTPRAAIKKGLDDVLSFRSFQRRMKGSNELKVTFIPESHWLDEWSVERRLAIVFEPKMPPASNSLEISLPKALLVGCRQDHWF